MYEEFFEIEEGTIIGFSADEPIDTLIIPAEVNGETVYGVGANAFECASIKNLIIEEGITFLDGCAFMYSDVETVSLPSTLTDFSGGVFADCDKLKSIVIPEGTEWISDFSGCTSLTSVLLPSTMKKIDAGAFMGCTSLKSIIVPDGTESIENGAFANCTSLTSIIIPESVTRIGTNAFMGCKSLANVMVSSKTAFCVDSFDPSTRVITV